MTTLTRSPLLSSVNTLFNDFFDDDRFLSSELRNGGDKIPSANVVENDNEFKIELAAPGMKKSDFKVAIDKGQLTISSEKKDEKEEKGENFTRREFSYNSFSRSFLLPDSVDTEKIKATYEEGLLLLNLPKKAEMKKFEKKVITIN